MSEPSSSIGPEIPIGPVKGTSLYYIWICDVSDSMRSGNKIGEMNKSIDSAISGLQKISRNTPNLQILMRTITFANSADWIDSDFIPLDSYHWKPLEAEQEPSDLGESLSKVADALRFKKDGGIMPERSKRPHLVLVTDGYPDDDWETGLKKLDSTFWGKRAVRMAIAIDDADIDVLKQFVGNVENADEKIIHVLPLEIIKDQITF
jgi:uncharacterized protein YegL